MAASQLASSPLFTPALPQTNQTGLCVTASSGCGALCPCSHVVTELNSFRFLWSVFTTHYLNESCPDSPPSSCRLSAPPTLLVLFILLYFFSIYLSPSNISLSHLFIMFLFTFFKIGCQVPIHVNKDLGFVHWCVPCTYNNAWHIAGIQ